MLLYRHGDAVSCLHNAGTHMGMRLDGGYVEDGTLRCPSHGFVYRLETGECLTVPEVQLAVHAIKVEGSRRPYSVAMRGTDTLLVPDSGNNRALLWALAGTAA